MPKLNQILAIERNVKNKREDEFTQIHQSLAKTDLLFGLSRTYQPLKDDGERFPSENKVVQIKADEALKKLKLGLAELFDVTAQKDITNCVAKADVVVDGTVLLTSVPATHLLYVEKKLVDLITFIKKLPMLPQDEKWSRNDALGLWETAPIETVKTKKIEGYTVIVPPTVQHPAQTAKTVEDVTVGSWKTVKYSGAMTADQISSLLERAEKLQKAVKFAREEANQTPVGNVQTTGAAVMGYVFG